MIRLFIFSAVFVFANAYWSYDDQAHWGQVAAICTSGSSQSPINLSICRSDYDDKLSELSIDQNYGRSSERMRLKNNGHSLHVSMFSEIMLKGAGLSGFHKVAQIHFHWGKNNSEGSEHFRFGKKYAMEMHIVAYDSKRFSSISQALDYPNSLAVVAVLFRASAKHNLQLDHIIPDIPNVIHADTAVKIRSFTIDKLLPKNRSRFFRYNGSLTTPGCQQVVTWTVMDRLNYISYAQLDAFRTLQQRSGATIAGNFRNTQSINQRIILRSFK